MKCRRLLLLLPALVAVGACSAAVSPDGGTGGTTGTGTTTGGEADSGPSPDAGLMGDAGPPAHLGDPCDPHAASDRCSGYGLICDATNATCRWPNEYEPCTPQVGCADGSLQCLSFEASGTHYQICFHPCATTDDCPTIFSACRTSGVLQGYCDAVRCGPYFDAGALFATCEIGSSSTGSCIPTLTPGLGLCYASGAAPEGAECSMTRPAGGGADMLCGPQLTCVGINPLGTFCKPLCSPMTSIPGPACAQGDLCLSVDPYSDTGACFQSCAGTGVCPPGTTCANFQSADGQAIVCLP